jgi:hypothetical protein
LLVDANRYQFSSKEKDSNSGLIYYLYRYYDPNLQRWPNRDPLGDIGFEFLAGHTLLQKTKFPILPLRLVQHERNLFVFDDNGPTDMVDKFGLCPNNCFQQYAQAQQQLQDDYISCLADSWASCAVFGIGAYECYLAGASWCGVHASYDQAKATANYLACLGSGPHGPNPRYYGK